MKAKVRKVVDDYGIKTQDQKDNVIWRVNDIITHIDPDEDNRESKIEFWTAVLEAVKLVKV